jgi:DNA-binding CsgD family transcriptional regulator
MTVRLSPREAEIAKLVAGAYADDEIAERLGISVRTVHTHLDRIAKKLDASSSPHRRRRVIRDFVNSESSAA